MAVAFDAAGPTASGTSVTSAGATTTLSWTHTAGAGANAILVGVNLEDGSNETLTVTCNGTGMTSLGVLDTAGHTTVDANYQTYLQVFIVSGAAVTAGGGNAIVVTSNAALPNATAMTGGSLSFSGYTGYGNIVTSYTAKSLTWASTTSGYLLAGFFCTGDTITQAGAPATGRLLDNFRGGTSPDDTGNVAAATAPSTGSAVTITWATSATAYCAIGVELQGSTGTAVTPAAAGGTGSAADTAALAVTGQLSGTNYAGTGTDLGGASGTWANPAYAAGTGSGDYAAWAVP